MSKKGLIARMSALLLLPAAFAATAFTAVGCGDDAKTPDAGIDAPPPAPAALSMTPQTGDFGSVTLGNTSMALSFTVTNMGGSPSGGISAIATGTNASDFAVQTTCTTLVASGTCQVSVTFTPAAIGAASGMLVVSGSPGGTVMATLSGAAVDVSKLHITPSSNAFPDTVIGQTSANTTFTVTNGGGVTTGTLTVTAGGSNPSQFTKVSDTCNGMTLAAAGTCTIVANFKPTSHGPQSASFDVSANPGGMVSGAVSGNGLNPAHVVVTPPAQDFGTQVIGTTGGNFTFTFTNTGDVATSALPVPVIGGADATSYVLGPQTCTGAVLAANSGSSCTALVHFTPAGAAGAKAGTLTATAATGGAAVATLNGTAATAGAITSNPPAKDYGTVTVGTDSASQTFTITNNGGSPAGPLATALAGANPNSFVIVGGSNGCNGTTIPGGLTCTIAVVFHPLAGGALTSNLNITGAGPTLQIPLQGVGQAAAHLSISPTSKDFGSVTVATNSATQTFTVTNDGGQSTTVAPAVTINGTNSTEFSFVAGACPVVLTAGANCTIVARFNPTTTGAKTASLDVAAGAAAVSAPLSGNGITNAQIAVNPSSLTFALTNVGDSATMQSFTVTNNGATTTGAIQVNKSGINAADFSTITTCTTLTNLQSCTVTVTFTPTGNGTRLASIDVSGVPGGAASVAVSGTAHPRLEILLPNTNPLDFGNVDILAFGPCTLIRLRNNTASTQTLTQTLGPNIVEFFFPFAGNPQDFDICTTSLANPGCNTGDMLLPGGTCDSGIDASPDMAGPVNSTILWSISAAVTGPDTATLAMKAVGTTGALTIQPCTGGNCTGSATPAFDFGNVPTQTTKSQVFTVTNQGMAATGRLQTQLTGSTAYHITADACAASPSLAINGTCMFTVVYAPTAAVTDNALLNVVDQSGAVTPSAQRNLTGKGIGQAKLVGIAAQFDFGPVFDGAQSGIATLTLTNTGDVNTTAITVAISGADFAIVGPIAAGDCVSGSTILAPVLQLPVAPAVASCTVRVRYSPTDLHAGSVVHLGTVTATAATGGTTGFANDLKGTSVSTIHVTYTSGGLAAQNLGNVPLNQTSGTLGNPNDLTYTITNDSAQTVSVTAIANNQAEFTVVSNMCGTPLTPSGMLGSTCTVAVRFAPTAPPAGGAGSSCPSSPGCRTNDTLTVTATNGLATQTGIFANAVAIAQLAIAPTSFDFGSILAGGGGTPTSSTETFTITNTGFPTTGAVTITVTNSVIAVLNYTLGAINCSGGSSVAGILGGGSCTIVVNFTPVTGQSGTVTGTLAAAAAGNNTVTANLTGNALGNGSLQINPATFDFDTGVVTSNAASTTSPAPTHGTALTKQTGFKDFAIQNSGGASVALTLAIPADFARDAVAQAGDPAILNNCGATLNAGATCNARLRFAPASSAGQKSGQVVAANGVYASVLGTALSNANVTGLPATAAFGNVQVGLSQTLSFVVTNLNSQLSGVIGSTTTGADSIQFLAPTGTCVGANLAPNGACSLTLTFAPLLGTGVGAKAATFTLTTTGGIAVVVALTGTGVNAPQISISPTSTAIAPIDDGNRAVGKLDTVPTVFTISNNVGSSPTGKLSLTAGFGGSNDWVYTKIGLTNAACDTSNIAANATVLAGGAKCDIGLLFNPTTITAHTFTFTVTDPNGSDPTPAQSGFVTGTGTQLLTGPATCGPAGCTTPVALGTGSATVALVFTNNASVATHVLSVDTTSLGTQVSVKSDTCSTNFLAAGATCTITVQYVPDGLAGPTNAVLTVSAVADLTIAAGYGATLTTGASAVKVTFTP